MIHWRNPLARVTSVLFRILLLLIPTVTLGIVIFGSTSLGIIEGAVKENALEGMRRELQDQVHQVALFHHRAKSDLLLAMEHEALPQYFSLEETRQGNRHDQNGILMVTKRQQELRESLERWAAVMQQRMPIVEVCLVDRSGQEHMRAALGKTAPVEEFSREEQKSPFFQPTMAMNQGEVHVSTPYISPDANEWVFAYTSPIFLPDGSKPGFFHYEIPLSHFRRMVLGTADQPPGKDAPPTGERRLILNQEGLAVFDSHVVASFTKRPAKNDDGGHAHGGGEETLDRYVPHAASLYPEPAFRQLVAAMTRGESGATTFLSQGTTYHIVHAPLPMPGWSIAEIHPDHLLLEGRTSLDRVRTTIAGIGLATLLATTLVMVLGIKGIIAPLRTLTERFQEIACGRLEVAFPVCNGQDEIAKLVRSSQKMTGMWLGLIRELRNRVEELSRSSDGLHHVAIELAKFNRDSDQKSGEISTVLSVVETQIQAISQASREASRQMQQVLQITQQSCQNIQSLFVIEAQAAGNLQGVVVGVDQLKEGMDAIQEGVSTAERYLVQVSAASHQVTSRIDAIQKECLSAQHHARQGTRWVTETLASMEQLTQSTHAIGGFAQLIDTIAEQSNMLALNAFIEAAGAGAMGKGFAVVAGEVKQLSEQTVKITEEITDKADRIHQERQQTTQSIGRLADSIQTIDLASHGIALSVQEQQSAAQDIAASIQTIARSAQQISGQVVDANRGIGAIAVNVAEVAGGLEIAHDQFGKIAKEMDEVAAMSQSTYTQNHTIDELSHALANQSHDVLAIVALVRASSDALSHLSQDVNHHSDSLKESASRLREQLAFFVDAA